MDKQAIELETLEFKFNHAYTYSGWMDCYIVLNGDMCFHLDASDFCPPFKDLLNFVRLILTQRLPCEFDWDQEGSGARFEALPVANSANFRFRLTFDDCGYEFTDEPSIDIELGRQWFADIVTATLQDLVQNAKPPCRTGGSGLMKDWGLSADDLIQFDKLAAEE